MLEQLEKLCNIFKFPAKVTAAQEHNDGMTTTTTTTTRVWRKEGSAVTNVYDN